MSHHTTLRLNQSWLRWKRLSADVGARQRRIPLGAGEGQRCSCFSKQPIGKLKAGRHSQTPWCACIELPTYSVLAKAKVSQLRALATASCTDCFVDPEAVQAGLLEAAAACTGGSMANALIAVVLSLMRHSPPLPSTKATDSWQQTTMGEVCFVSIPQPLIADLRQVRAQLLYCSAHRRAHVLQRWNRCPAALAADCSTLQT